MKYEVGVCIEQVFQKGKSCGKKTIRELSNIHNPISAHVLYVLFQFPWAD